MAIESGWVKMRKGVKMKEEGFSHFTLHPSFFIIGVMGGGTASPEDAEAAYRLGSLIAEQGWILLNGGRSAGIMESSAKGAADRGGLTIGILPDDDYTGVSEHIAIPVLTGMGKCEKLH